jgi:D-tyrosyl-tRNA(Tyr) deacylase
MIQLIKGVPAVRALIQRVSQASVDVNGHVVGQISIGLLILLAIARTDTLSTVEFLASKCAKLRIFEDPDGKMNLSLLDVKGSALVVSQFTLCSDCGKGNRPSFDTAEQPDAARTLYELFIAKLSEHGVPVATGEFGASMQIHLINDGPATFLLESKK